MFCWCTLMVVSRLDLERKQDKFHMNLADKPEFWFTRYNMLFAPSFLHNTQSAHYLEISHIYAVEMFKRYQLARQEILADREKCSDKEKRTRYCENPNYIYEPLGVDAPKMF